jgi:hypothetical protein
MALLQQGVYAAEITVHKLRRTAFHSISRDGGRKLGNWENSTKSGKAGSSGVKTTAHQAIIFIFLTFEL